MRRSNWFARCAVVSGLLTLAVVPLAVAASRRSGHVTLLEATGAIAASGLLALLTLLLARRGRIYDERSLGRAGGRTLVRIARILGLLGLCLAIAACIALAFYTLLRIFS